MNSESRLPLPATLGWLAYAAPFLTVAIAIVVTAIMSHFFTPEPIGLLMLSAVIATAWLAGLGPALLAILLALIAFQYNIAAPANLFVWKRTFFEVDLSEAPRLVMFTIVSLIVSFVITAQSNATEALRR